MRRLILAAAASVALAGAAAAAPVPAPAPAYHPPRLFLSPSGEPFHATPDAPDPLATWFAAADTAHLGYLDRAEFRADAARFFRVLDENGDGVIDGFEVADYEQKVVPELADWSEGIPVGDTGAHHDGGPGGGRHDHDGQGHDGRDHDHRGGDNAGSRPSRAPAIAQLVNDPEPVMAADFNFDSHITLAEWMRATDARFDSLDANKDGKLTLDELHTRLARNTPARPPRPPPPPAQNGPGGPDQPGGQDGPGGQTPQQAPI